MRSDNQEVRDIAQNFNDGMDNLADLFSSFVQQNNMPFRILRSKSFFLTDSRKSSGQIKERIRRKDGKLYLLAED
jgi:hypothetical protein